MPDDSSPEKPLVDTRGLPQGYDPRMFYEYRFGKFFSKTAPGVEYLLWKYIPKSIIVSVVFAIDPLRDFKVAPHAITPKNRQRFRATDSVLLSRRLVRVAMAESDTYQVNYGGIALCYSPTTVHESASFPYPVVELDSQPPLPGIINDTTRRTRLIGSEQGTMDSFHGTAISSSRSVRRVTKYKYTFHDTDDNPQIENCRGHGGVIHRSYNLSTDSFVSDIVPSSAVFPLSTYNNLRLSEIAYLEELMASKALAMFKDWSPYRRNYTLFRNVVELKDLSRSVASLQRTLKDFAKLSASLGSKSKLRDSIFDLKRTAKNIPNEYLSYHFGWKMLYKDLMDLLATPEKLSKKMAFLIKRAGKPTTFRTKRSFVSALSEGVSGFVYDISPFEQDSSTTQRLARETELRMVINATFDFPPPSGVSFRIGSFLDSIGVIPRPTDLYNLVPWTWLLDWFTGLGNYIEVIDNINRDPGLINWGMITGQTKGKIITNYKAKSLTSTYLREDGIPDYTLLEELQPVSHESVLLYECRIRKDMAQVLDVNTTAGLNLSAYQLSILGALLAQRLDHTTPRFSARR